MKIKRLKFVINNKKYKISNSSYINSYDGIIEMEEFSGKLNR